VGLYGSLLDTRIAENASDIQLAVQTCPARMMVGYNICTKKDAHFPFFGVAIQAQFQEATTQEM
jgi:hypothetical protein